MKLPSLRPRTSWASRSLARCWLTAVGVAPTSSAKQLTEDSPCSSAQRILMRVGSANMRKLSAARCACSSLGMVRSGKSWCMNAMLRIWLPARMRRYSDAMSHHGDAEHHDQDHAHDHPTGGWRAALHALEDLVRPHSHEGLERTDAAMETSREGLRVIWISLAALGLTAALQAVVVFASGSVALLGDTLHNAVDALTAVPLGIAFTIGRRAATRRYTYGYGRAEDLAGIVIVVLIALSSLFAGYAAVRRLAHPQPVTHLWAVAAAGFIGFLGNELVARYRIRVGRQIGSAALVADGLHARTDGFTSLAVLLGAGGVALGLPWADPVVGLLITVAILGVLRSAVKQVGARLMDAVDPQLVEQAEAAVSTVDG